MTQKGFFAGLKRRREPVGWGYGGTKYHGGEPRGTADTVDTGQWQPEPVRRVRIRKYQIPARRGTGCIARVTSIVAHNLDDFT